MIINADIPFELIIGGSIFIVALIGATVFFGSSWYDLKNNHPELHVLQKSRHKPFPPVITMVDPSGRMFLFNGEKENSKEIKLKKDDYGLLLDPLQTAKMPKSRFEDGTGCFYYGAGFHFPTDPNGARTIVQFVRRIRKEYHALNFIRDDVVLIELFTKSGDDLLNDIKNIMKSYPLEDYYEEVVKSTPKNKEPIPKEAITPESISSMIEEIKGKTKGWMVQPGWFSMNEGISLLPIGTMSSDMKRLETITKINTMNDMAKEATPWDSLVRFALIIMAALVIAYMVIVNVRPPGK